MSRRYISPALFLVAAVVGLLAAFERLGFYGGVAAIGFIVLGVAALPLSRAASRDYDSEP